MNLRIVPLTLAQANELVAKLHRHHKPVVGHRFSLGCSDSERGIIGAAIVGRPKSRMIAQYDVAEVTRLVTDGTPNACSMLYGAAARVCREMGFDSIRTYTLASEPGTSLRASGWRLVGVNEGGQWDHTGETQLLLDAYVEGKVLANRSDQPNGAKRIWEKSFR